MDCSLPGSSAHRILQAGVLEWVAISFSRQSSWPRDWTQVPHIAIDALPSEPPGKLPANCKPYVISMWSAPFPKNHIWFSNPLPQSISVVKHLSVHLDLQSTDLIFPHFPFPLCPCFPGYQALIPWLFIKIILMHIFLILLFSLFHRDGGQHCRSPAFCPPPHIQTRQSAVTGGKHMLICLTLTLWLSFTKEPWYCLAVLLHMSNLVNLLSSATTSSFLFSLSSTFSIFNFFCLFV